MHLHDLLTAMMHIQKHLPDDQKQSILNKSKKRYAIHGLHTAKKLWLRFHGKQVVDALNIDRSQKFYFLIDLFYFKLLFNKV